MPRTYLNLRWAFYLQHALLSERALQKTKRSSLPLRNGAEWENKCHQEAVMNVINSETDSPGNGCKGRVIHPGPEKRPYLTLPE